MGALLRSTGRAIDDFGFRLRAPYAYAEKLTPSMATMTLQSTKPQLGENVFVAPNANVIGDVKIGNKSSIWYGALLRGDVNSITIGEETNIQDNVIVHVAKNTPKPVTPLPTVVGNRVTIGHGAILHACTIEDDCMVGMGAQLLDGVKMERSSIVAAGCMVPPKTIIRSGHIYAGVPCRILRQLTVDEAVFIATSAGSYAELAALHQGENSKTFDEVEWDKIVRQDRLERDPDYDGHLGISRDVATREIKAMRDL